MRGSVHARACVRVCACSYEMMISVLTLYRLGVEGGLECDPPHTRVRAGYSLSPGADPENFTRRGAGKI